MNEMMLEATRLTQASRLVEATALIQRMLRGEADSEISCLGNSPATIDGLGENSMKRRLPTSTRGLPLSGIIFRGCAIQSIASNPP